MLLRTEHVSKQFNGVYALKDINFQVKPGEIHGLVGENGAGKSTLIKILTGVYQMDEGQIFWNEAPVSTNTPVKSRQVGINVIHQDRVLIPAFNGVENAYLGMDYINKSGHIDWNTMKENVQKVADELGIEINLSLTAQQLSPPQKTCLEIIRSMMTECKLLILDEPTAALTEKEAEILFGIVQRLREKGTSILYVTHRMDEIFRLTDRITVFKNGEMVKTVQTADVDREQLIALMTDNWTSETMAHNYKEGEVLLEAEHIASKDGMVKDASIVAHRNEILGVFGLGGSGRTELMECIYGYRPMLSGKVTVAGQEMTGLSPEKSIKNGVALICEDRRGKAMIGNLSIKDNILLSTIDDYSKLGVLDEKKEIKDAAEKVAALEIKIAGLSQKALQLSGGNQQKVVFAKALSTAPEIFLCDEPTQAVDVKTRAEIHRLLRQEADQGKAVVFVSSDLKEVLEVADNIQIMARGETRELLKNENLTAQEVLSCCYRV